MIRVGVRFEGLLFGDQLRLERDLFGERHSEPWLLRQLLRLLPGQRRVERRRAPRISVVQEGDLLVRREPARGRSLTMGLSVVMRGSSSEPRPLPLCSLSAAGCAYLCSEREAAVPGQLLSLEIRGLGLALPVGGRVVYAVLET